MKTPVTALKKELLASWSILATVLTFYACSLDKGLYASAGFQRSDMLQWSNESWMTYLEKRRENCGADNKLDNKTERIVFTSAILRYILDLPGLSWPKTRSQIIYITLPSAMKERQGHNAVKKKPKSQVSPKFVLWLHFAICLAILFFSV